MTQSELRNVQIGSKVKHGLINSTTEPLTIIANDQHSITLANADGVQSTIAYGSQIMRGLAKHLSLAQ